MTSTGVIESVKVEQSTLSKVCFQLEVKMQVARRMLKRFNPKAPKAFLRYDTDEERRFATGFFALSQKTQRDLVQAVSEQEWP